MGDWYEVGGLGKVGTIAGGTGTWTSLGDISLLGGGGG